MNNINFYEVVDKKDRWVGSYSTQFDTSIQVGQNSLQMAKTNAVRSSGKIFSVDFEGKRELVWPK
ncbi:hypothetical protein N9955_00340 [bacterium]|nr:hypothetical protein [bacterium]